MLYVQRSAEANHSSPATRLTITASCPMDLQYFPMDSQLCYIEIESCKWCTGAHTDIALPQVASSSVTGIYN